MMVPHRNSDLAQVTVNANTVPDDSVDCGFLRLGWCRGATCKKYARLRTFVMVLAGAGLLQGACETYFRIAAKKAALQYGYNVLVVDWLVVSSGLVQAVFALSVAFWAHKQHPISWLGGSIMLQSAVCIIAVIPSILSFSEGVGYEIPIEEVSLCDTTLPQLHSSSILLSNQNAVLVLVMLFVLQLALGIAAVAFYTIGVIYVDDNSTSIDSPAVIATVLAAKLIGLQAGSVLTIGVGATSVGWWLGWTILAPMVFVSGVLLALFPKRLPKTVIHQAAQRIIEQTYARNLHRQSSAYIDDPAFGPSLKRLFGNKLLMCNLLSVMLVESATLNYMLQEESYLQSRFFLPYSEEDGLQQEWSARFISYFLKPPVAAVGMLLAGLVISKLKFSGRKIAGIGISLSTLLFLIYVAHVFVKCDVGPIAGVSSGRLQQPFCSRQCICTPTSFQPVCPENSTATYFSPCYSGCSMKTSINNVAIYEGCTCGLDNDYTSWKDVRATEGACSADTCARMLTVFQVLSLLSASILGTLTVGKIIITLRSVLPQDKPMALASQLTLVGLFAYVPAKLGYDVATRVTCIYWAPEYSRCLLRETPKHGNILNIMTASLILISLLFDVLVFIFSRGLNVYHCKVTDVDYSPSLYSPLPTGDRDDQGTSLQPENRRTDPNPEITVFRDPSSVTSSSTAEVSLDPKSGISYAQVVFPPDKQKTTDDTSSPKRLAVRADVPLHHLTEQDVRTQLGGLRTFNAAARKEEDVDDVMSDLNSSRLQSPETDF